MGVAESQSFAEADDDNRGDPNGGPMALGHPLGAICASLATTAVNQLHRIRKQHALCAMCIGVDQGIAVVLECGGHDFGPLPKARAGGNLPSWPRRNTIKSFSADLRARFRERSLCR